MGHLRFKGLINEDVCAKIDDLKYILQFLRIIRFRYIMGMSI